MPVVKMSKAPSVPVRSRAERQQETERLVQIVIRKREKVLRELAKH